QTFALPVLVYANAELIKGSKDGLTAIKEKKIPFKFLSNTTTKTAEDICDSLTKMGIDVVEDQIITPVSLAYDFLQSRNQKALPVIRESLKPYFESVTEIDQPDWILIGDIGSNWNQELLDRLFEKIENGAGILAMHKNAFSLNENKKVLDIGAFIAALEYGSKKNASVLGKPSEMFFSLAVENFEETKKDKILMIGDDPYADIEGAQNYGLSTLFVKSGKASIEDLHKANVEPDYVLNSLADIQSIL
ncbi:MAG: HAD-IIA family hydrolase, partial [Cyclobacteriaceae bacterium]